MKVIEVSRTVSGQSYDNLCAKAAVEDGDSVEKVALELDKQLRQSLNKIYEREQEVDTKRRDRDQTVQMLEDALAYAKSQATLPF